MPFAKRKSICLWNTDLSLMDWCDQISVMVWLLMFVLLKFPQNMVYLWELLVILRLNFEFFRQQSTSMVLKVRTINWLQVTHFSTTIYTIQHNCCQYASKQYEYNSIELYKSEEFCFRFDNCNLYYIRFRDAIEDMISIHSARMTG